MAFLSINNGLVSVTPAGEKLGGKGLRLFVVNLAIPYVTKWAKPLLVSLVVALIKEAAKKDSIEKTVEEIIHELDPDQDGQLG